MMSTSQTGSDIDAFVREIRLESLGVVSVRVERPQGVPLPAFEPGAHIDVRLDDLQRQYSLVSSPTDTSHYRFAVRLEDSGRGGSEYVHRRLRVGDTLTISIPRNRFPLEPAEEYLFIAGGIGITPLLSMIQRVDEQGTPWRLAYAGRSVESMPFLAGLRDYSSRVELYVSGSGHRLSLPDLLADASQQTAIYCCGPERMIAELEQNDSIRGRLHLERFVASELAAPVRTDSFEVVCQASRKTVQVQPAQSILEALEAAGLPIDHDCREGICGSCEVKVLEGVPDHRDSLLSPEEREASETMMVCVSRSCGARLVIDV